MRLERKKTTESSSLRRMNEHLCQVMLVDQELKSEHLYHQFEVARANLKEHLDQNLD